MQIAQHMTKLAKIDHSSRRQADARCIMWLSAAWQPHITLHSTAAGLTLIRDAGFEHLK